MFFVAHEHIIRQAIKQIKGLDRKLLPTIVQGAYFPDIKKLPFSRFYKGNTHFITNEKTFMRCTPWAKAYTWGWRLHILADNLWHKGIYNPLKSPICINVGDYDPIRNQIMSHLEHMMREIALDIYIIKNSGNSGWGISENLALKELFKGRDRISELGFWNYKQLIKAYIRMFIPFSHVLIAQKLPRKLVRNYLFITEEVPTSVNKMLKTAIASSVQALKEYLREK